MKLQEDWTGKKLYFQLTVKRPAFFTFPSSAYPTNSLTIVLIPRRRPTWIQLSGLTPINQATGINM